MSLKSMVMGPVETNVYFLINDETGETAVFDPAYAPEKILSFAERNKLKITSVLLTHGHFDHIGAVEDLKKKTNATVYASKNEERLLKDPDLNESLMGYGYSVTVDADIYLSDGQFIEAAGFKIKMLATPGHTEGSCCYYIEDEKMLISGDTLFCGSVGRTDLPTGSMEQLINSIHEKILPLPDDIAVYPGHGEETDIGYERKWNPFF